MKLVNCNGGGGGVDFGTEVKLFGKTEAVGIEDGDVEIRVEPVNEGGGDRMLRTGELIRYEKGEGVFYSGEGGGEGEITGISERTTCFYCYPDSHLPLIQHYKLWDSLSFKVGFFTGDVVER